VKILRRTVVLLLAVGVLLMHAQAAGSSPASQAVAKVHSAAMVMQVQPPHEASPTLPRMRTSRSPSPSMPAGCSGGAVCRAVLATSGLHLLPAVAAVLPDTPTARFKVRPIAVCQREVAGPPPTRSRLQVWRC
jgi:hypothetical protein